MRSELWISEPRLLNGNSAAIAARRYLQVTDADFERANQPNESCAKSGSINRVVAIVMEANCLDEAKLKKAREVFLLGQALMPPEFSGPLTAPETMMRYMGTPWG